MDSYRPAMGEWYAFDCPECSAAFTVDAPARDRLLVTGCVRCGAALSLSAFVQLSEAPSVVP